MEGKTFTGPSPPYEATPSHPPPQGPIHTGSYNTSPPVSYNAQAPVPSHSPPPANHSPTPYPHPPIAPLDSQHQNYAQHPPPGSPPPQIAHASPPLASPPITHVQPTPGMSSPGQEKQEYYHVNAASVPQQTGIPMQNHPGMPPQQQSGQYAAPAASVYHTVTPLHALHEGPAPVDCPVCHTRAMTRTEKHAGNTVHAWAAVLCFCLCLGCIPYLITSLKDTEHFCGHCGVMLATYKNSGHTVVHQHG